MASQLSNLKVGEKETIITEICAVTVERTSRGSFATVTDAGSESDGEYVFAALPSYAFEMLLDKIAAGVAA